MVLERYCGRAVDDYFIKSVFVIKFSQMEVRCVDSHCRVSFLLYYFKKQMQWGREFALNA